MTNPDVHRNMILRNFAVRDSGENSAERSHGRRKEAPGGRKAHPAYGTPPESGAGQKSKQQENKQKGHNQLPDYADRHKILWI